jgi:HEAT repeats
VKRAAVWGALVPRALVWLACAPPLASQPRLPSNAQVDTRSAAAGLEPQFRALLAAQPQPAWIGWPVPSVRSYPLGCEFVGRDGWAAPGVIHLEPPDHAVILLRIANNAVERIRALSPDCEIDAGGLPVHWLNDVKPAESVALLASLDKAASIAVAAIAMHADASADAALDRFAAAGQPQSLRLRALAWLGSVRGRHGFEVLKNAIASDPDERIREHAIVALGSNKDPEAVEILIATARHDRNPRLRAQAVTALGRKSGPDVAAAIRGIVENDEEMQVRRRAVSALPSLPDGQGIPLLIDLVKTTGNAELRQQAMSALEQTRDPRALAFFEQVLR